MQQALMLQRTLGQRHNGCFTWNVLGDSTEKSLRRLHRHGVDDKVNTGQRLSRVCGCRHCRRHLNLRVAEWVSPLLVDRVGDIGTPREQPHSVPVASHDDTHGRTELS
jgi:hypothetical protein